MALKRVLIVSDEMEVGGSQRQIVNIIRNLDKSQYCVDLAYFTNPSALLDEVRPHCNAIIDLQKTKKLDFGFAKRFFRLCHSGNYDLVHAFSFSGEAWTMIMHVLCAGRFKFISSIRGRYEWYSKAQWKIKQLVSSRSVLIVSNSKSGAQYALESMSETLRAKIQIVYNGIPLDTSELSHRLYRDSVSTILFVGRLVDHKNIPCLLRALAKLKNNSVKLLLAGDGPLREEMEGLCASLDISDRVEFLGERDDVRELMLEADLAVLPSFREGLSNTIIEALNFGTPIVASKVGGTPEMITHQANGLLFESDNEDSLVAELEKLQDNQSMREQLAINGRESVKEKFSTAAMISTLQAVYSKALNGEQ